MEKEQLYTKGSGMKNCHLSSKWKSTTLCIILNKRAFVCMLLYSLRYRCVVSRISLLKALMDAICPYICTLQQLSPQNKFLNVWIAGSKMCFFNKNKKLPSVDKLQKRIPICKRISIFSHFLLFWGFTNLLLLYNMMSEKT